MRRIVSVLAVVAAMLAVAAPAFGAANDRASCVGAQRSTAEQGDVGRISRAIGSDGLFDGSLKGQNDFATQGKGPGRTVLAADLDISGSGAPGKPADEITHATISCATVNSER